MKLLAYKDKSPFEANHQKNTEIWFYQLEGISTLITGKGETLTLSTDCTYLMESNMGFTHMPQIGSVGCCFFDGNAL